MGSLRCAATGFPLPQVTWYLNGSLLLNSSQVAISTDVADLIVTVTVDMSSATSNNSGNYSCRVESPLQQYRAVTRYDAVFVQGKLAYKLLSRI